MNDFTKEELQTIGACVFIKWMHSLTDPTASNEKIENYKLIKDKIQSMLVSFCDHEWDNTCCGCRLQSLICQKCKKQFIEDEE